MSESRVFRTTDPDFPTTKILQDRLRQAGRVEGGSVAVLRAAVPAPAAAAVAAASTLVRPPAYPHVLLGSAGNDQVYLGLDKLMAGRLLIQGSSGAGKSTALRRIIEGAHSAVTVVIVDPEGEFGNLAAHIGATTIMAAETAGDGLAAAALAAREHRVPLHIDLTDVEPDVRIQKAAAFLGALLASPREFWGNSLLVAIDEAHLLAPQLAASARDAETRRLGGSPALKPSSGLDHARARELLRLDQFEERVPALQSAPPGKGVRLVDDFLLAPAAIDAARLMSALVPIAPNATTSAELSKHLALDFAAVDAAIDLLASLGAVDVIRRDDSRIVRLAARLRLKIRDTKVVGLA